MAKYSTGSSGGNSSGSCELCGASDVELQTANVAGAQLEVCGSCAQHDDNTTSSDDDSRESRDKRAAKNMAKMHDAAKQDSSHWEGGADYDEDQLPYLVSGYDELVTSARQDAGYQLEELATELGIDDSDLLALEQARATQAGVGGSTVAALEEFLDITLIEE
ncbi:helix-turn-helix domain-containing protein [Halovenus salina]|uniref:Multiprotein-bridging factor 1 family protein n=1 Tax=Halovenus salina TaxID=1510225 RepID=A0ABD5VYM6_9EURY|nr:multiprotein-bridging factor 1 family protein [Halovenus salina]